VRQRNEFVRVGRRDRERFVDHHVLARSQGLRGKFEMAAVGRGNHNQVDALFRKHFIRIAQQLGLRIFLPGFIAVTLDNVREAQVWIRLDQGRVKHPARKTETDETYVEGIGHGVILSAMCRFKKALYFHEL
jgi:hypothetical protein